MIGTTLLHYRILEKLGAGGQGTVYKALNTKLNRPVVIKVLPPELTIREANLKRFEREARLASALDHPNICTIFDFNEVGGVNFIVMQYVEGPNVRQLVKGHPLEVQSALSIAIQVADALAAAHARGIIHRDIKAGNVMVTNQGQVKVLDFGLAKLSDESVAQADGIHQTQLTEIGVPYGTATYAAPEQARGDRVDKRADIFSTGVLLYEMLTGTWPFHGKTSIDVRHAVLHDTPQPLAEFRTDVLPPSLQQILDRALAKEPRDRYQRIENLRDELKGVLREISAGSDDAEFREGIAPRHAAGTGRVARRLRWLRNLGTIKAPAVSFGGTEQPVVAIVKEQSPRTGEVQDPTSSAEHLVSEIKLHKRGVTIAVAVLLLAVLGFGYWFFARTPSKATQIESLAVLPFVNESGNNDIEYLSDGMTETLISSLSQLPKLNVKARSSVFRYKGKDTNAQTIGKELNVQAILNGTVVQRGSDLALHIELIDAQTESVLWSADYKQPMTNLVSLQSEITRDVSSKLKVKLSGADEEKVRKSYTANPEAYQLYLKGRFYWNRRTAENLKKAIEQFQQAADKDPNYALAYVGLSDCYQLLEDYAGTPASETLPKAKRYAERALEIDDSLAEAHVSLGGIKNKLWQWNDSEKEFKRAIELNPNYPTAHHWYSVYLRFVRRFDESLTEIKLAQDLDPLSLIINDNLAQLYLVRGDVNASIDQYNKIVELDPNFASGRRWLGKAYLRKGAYPEALTELRKAVELSGRATADLGGLGYGYAVAGRRADALSILKELGEKYSRHEARGLDLAVVHTGLGEKDQAFVWLEKDYQGHSGTLGYLNWDVYFDSLRGDPRHVDLLRRIGLQQ